MDSTNNRPEDSIPENESAAETKRPPRPKTCSPRPRRVRLRARPRTKSPPRRTKRRRRPTRPPEDCAAKVAAEHDRYLRLAAEYDNYRKRSARERESIYSDVRADTVTKFLPVYDNLARALEQSTADEAYRKGVELIMTQFKDILSRLGVTEIEAMGQQFDPGLHNAVMRGEDETKGANEIVQELQKGFKLGDKVIRYAMVKVVNCD